MGHYGLTGFFGKELSPALNFIHTHNPRVRKLAGLVVLGGIKIYKLLVSMKGLTEPAQMVLRTVLLPLVWRYPRASLELDNATQQ